MPHSGYNSAAPHSKQQTQATCLPFLSEESCRIFISSHLFFNFRLHPLTSLTDKPSLRLAVRYLAMGPSVHFSLLSFIFSLFTFIFYLLNMLRHGQDRKKQSDYDTADHNTKKDNNQRFNQRRQTFHSRVDLGIIEVGNLH